MRRLADKKLSITLALSLHASNQKKRMSLMPVANSYDIHEVIDACRYYFEQTGRRVTFEYSLVGGVNDTDEDAAELSQLVAGMNCHINLIPVNPIKERDYVQSNAKVIKAFKNKLEKNGINVTIRREMGRDIDGACGQLRKKHIDKEKGIDLMKTFSVTDAGVVREMNQDYYFSSDTAVGNLPNLFIVADGMGGHKAGDYASRYTIERVVASVSRNTGEEPIAIMKEAINKANELLVAESREDESKSGMGTTLVIGTIIGNKLFVANIGDSRLYVVGQNMRQITRDHSLVDEMVRLGEINADEARVHPDKNIITRAVGTSDHVEADFFEVEITADDTILLCTDGLTNMVRDDEILDIIKKYDNAQAATMQLVKEANANGGRDNITVMIIKPF